MFLSHFSTFLLVALLTTFTTADLVKRAPGNLPDALNVPVKNLYPEDGVFDLSRNQLYQSNLWKGQISVYNPSDNRHFAVKIAGVSSTGDGSQQMAGLSLDSRDNPKHLYAVAKPADAFRFDAVHDKGPCSFHMFNLPLSASSTPAWSTDLRPAQAAFQQKYGVRPYGNVASAQDSGGNSYVIFALAAAAIAKVSPDGRTVEPWFLEKATSQTQRPGYTGIVYDRDTNTLITYGGPRVLTAFRLSDSNPTARPIQIKGDFGSLSGTEKIKLIPAAQSAGFAPRLIATKAPYIYSFSSSDKWSSVSFKRSTRSEFKNNGLTSVIEYKAGNARGIYGTGAYFAEGAHGGRISTPAYRIDKALLQ